MGKYINWNNEENSEYLEKNFPELLFVNDYEVRGFIRFSARHQHGTNIVQCGITSKDSLEICYPVKIVLPSESNVFPSVYTQGNSIERIMQKWDITCRADVHTYPNNKACLCPPPEELLMVRNNIDFITLVENYIIPYYYQITYFEKYGKWPFTNYSHGPAAIFEYYLRSINHSPSVSILLRDCIDSLLKFKIGISSSIGQLLSQVGTFSFKKNAKCFCGSNKKFIKCHRRLYRENRIICRETIAGLVQLYVDSKKNGIDLPKIIITLLEANKDGIGK